MSTKYLIHQPLEGRRSIREAKRNYEKLVMPEVSAERRFMNVLRYHESDNIRLSGLTLRTTLPHATH